MITAEQIQWFEVQQFNSPFPRVILRVRGYDTEVKQELLERMAFDVQFGQLMKDRVLFYREAIKYEQYVDFEMVGS